MDLTTSSGSKRVYGRRKDSCDDGNREGIADANYLGESFVFPNLRF